MLGGCVGFSRDAPKVLFPADSLSRGIAEATPIDTLTLVGHIDSAVAASDRAVVGSVRFGPDGRLWAADVANNRLSAFDPLTGRPLRTVDDAALAYPYLAGARGDTLGVLNAGDATFDLLVDGRVVGSRPLPATPSGDALSFFALLTPRGLFFKNNPDPGEATVVRLDAEGRAAGPPVVLPGPPWRHRGVLRAWGDTLLSLSGYRPVVDRLAPGGGVDSLALVGFDSPMLPQSRLFVLGETSEAPTLVTSAAAVGDRLFVLNVRPGWTRIDVYGRDGRLERVLIEPDPGVSGYNDLDLDVRADGAGGYLIAVARLRHDVFWFSSAYVPRVSVFRWKPEAGRTARGGN